MARITTFTDDFIRADSTDLGTVWDNSYTDTVNLQIVSNRVRGTVVSTAGNYETVNTPVLAADQWALLRIATLVDGAAIQAVTVHLRGTPPATWTCYMVEVVNAAALGYNSKISRINAGVETELITENTVVWGAGDYLLGTVEGFTLTLWRLAAGGNPNTDPFTSILSYTDNSAGQLSSGRPGLKIYVESSLADVEVDYYAAGEFDYGLVWLPQGATSGYAPTAVIPSGMISNT